MGFAVKYRTDPRFTATTAEIEKYQWPALEKIVFYLPQKPQYVARLENYHSPSYPIYGTKIERRPLSNKGN